MKVVYDLLAYSFTPHGGIRRLTDEMLKAFSDRPEFKGVLYEPYPLQRKPPRVQRTTSLNLPTLHGHLRRLQPLLNSLEAKRCRTLKADLFHPTFYPMHENLDHLPTILTVHDLIHEKIANADDMPDHNEFLQRKARYIQRADHIICISESTRDDMLEVYPVDASRVSVAPLAGDPYFHVMEPLTSADIVNEVLDEIDRPFLLYVGSRQRYKNFDGLAQAFAGWGERKNHRLVIVGGGARPADHDTLTEAGIEPGEVIFTGHLQDDQLCALYNRAAAFVYPSLAEGFGIPLLEAMASGCPTCVSDIAPFREVAGDFPVYFDPRNTESIQDALSKALLLREERGHMAEARKRAASFTWGNFTRAVWEVYEKVANHAA